MKRKYRKLLGLCLITGLGLQTLQLAEAHSVHKNSHRKIIKNNRKKLTSYRIHRHKTQQRYTAANVYDYTPDGSDSESGVASWYGGRHTNHRTASGKVFNNQAFTAAHPSLPLGTKVLVHSEDTGNSVIVTINDRGPFTGNRVIDLSKAAAAKIGMVHSGTAHVTITPVTRTEVAEAPDDSLPPQR